MSKINDLNEKFQILLGAVTDYMSDPTDGPAHAEKLFADLGRFESSVRTRGVVDGRANAWSEERRKEQGEKIAAAWAAKRAAKGESEAFYKFTYSDQPPEKLASLEAVAKDCGLSSRTLANKLSHFEAGFIIKVGRQQVAYVKNPDKLDYVLGHLAVENGDEDLRIVLPRKGGKRF